MEFRTLIAYNMSCAHSVAATNSTSVTDSVTQLCIRLVVEINAPLKNTAYPLTLLILSEPFAKLLLLNTEMSNRKFLSLSYDVFGLIISPMFGIAE